MRVRRAISSAKVDRFYATKAIATVTASQRETAAHRTLRLLTWGFV
jgi:hypothetical protein